MWEKLKKSQLVGPAAIYTITNIINSGIPFLLLPILTRVLSPAEYGLVSLFTSVVAIIGAFTGLSVHGAVSAKYYNKDIDHPKFIGASFLILTGSTFLVLLVLLIFSEQISDLTQLPFHWLLLAVLASAAQFAMNIRLVMWQVKGQPIQYGIFQISQTIFNLVLSILLIFQFSQGWQGRVIGIAAGMMVFGLIAIISLNLNKLVNWRGDFNYSKMAISFGVPLIPHVIGGFMISLSDRFIINSLIDVDAVGHYAVGVQMAMGIGLVSDAMVKAYGPYLFRMLSQDNQATNELIVRNTYLFILLFIIGTVAYIFLLPYLYSIFVGNAYADSISIAKVVAFGYAFQGMYYLIAGFLFYQGKTGRLSGLTIFGGCVNIVVSYALVNQFGYIGAAWAFATIQLLFFLGAWALAQKAHPMPWFNKVRGM